MNVSIAKKLEQLEKRFSVKNTPNLIMFKYSAGEGLYIVKEQYSKLDGKGNVTEGGYIRQRKINSLEEYVIPSEYTSQIIIDSSEMDGGIITTVNIVELRKTAKIGKAPFVFVQIIPADHEREVSAEIALIEKG